MLSSAKLTILIVSLCVIITVFYSYLKIGIAVSGTEYYFAKVLCGTVAVPATYSGLDVKFPILASDSANIVYDSQAGLFTIPDDGLYQIGCLFVLSALSTGSVTVLIDGAAFDSEGNVASNGSNGNSCFSNSNYYSLKKGAKIGLRVSANASLLPGSWWFIRKTAANISAA